MRVKNISMMINEAYFCLVFEGEKNKNKKKKKKEKKTDPANESHCGAPGEKGGIRDSGGQAAGTMRTWDEVWDGFRSERQRHLAMVFVLLALQLSVPTVLALRPSPLNVPLCVSWFI